MSNEPDHSFGLIDLFGSLFGTASPPAASATVASPPVHHGRHHRRHHGHHLLKRQAHDAVSHMQADTVQPRVPASDREAQTGYAGHRRNHGQIAQDTRSDHYASLGNSVRSLTGDNQTALYVIKTGQFILPDGTTFHGGSGSVRAGVHNNPTAQSAASGPIPEGTWNLGRTDNIISTFANGDQHHERGIFMSPSANVNTYGRDQMTDRYGNKEAFAIHPDNSHGQLSNIGCLSFAPQDAQAIFAAHDEGRFNRVHVVGYSPAMLADSKPGHGRGHRTEQERVAQNVTKPGGINLFGFQFGG